MYSVTECGAVSACSLEAGGVGESGGRCINVPGAASGVKSNGKDLGSTCRETTRKKDGRKGRGGDRGFFDNEIPRHLFLASSLPASSSIKDCILLQGR